VTPNTPIATTTQESRPRNRPSRNLWRMPKNRLRAPPGKPPSRQALLPRRNALASRHSHTSIVRFWTSTAKSEQLPLCSKNLGFKILSDERDSEPPLARQLLVLCPEWCARPI